jgi:hypothetical protein
MILPSAGSTRGQFHRCRLPFLEHRENGAASVLRDNRSGKGTPGRCGQSALVRRHWRASGSDVAPPTKRGAGIRHRAALAKFSSKHRARSRLGSQTRSCHQPRPDRLLARVREAGGKLPTVPRGWNLENLPRLTPTLELSEHVLEFQQPLDQSPADLFVTSRCIGKSRSHAKTPTGISVFTRSGSRPNVSPSPARCSASH